MLSPHYLKISIAIQLPYGFSAAHIVSDIYVSCAVYGDALPKPHVRIRPDFYAHTARQKTQDRITDCTPYSIISNRNRPNPIIQLIERGDITTFGDRSAFVSDGGLQLILPITDFCKKFIYRLNSA